MIGMSWDTAAIAVTQARLQQFNSKIRRQVLLKVGNAAAKPLLDAVKAEAKPQVTLTLQQSLTKKVKGYPGRNVVFVAVGPRSQVTEVSTYKDYRTGVMRRWKMGQPKKGPKRMNPAHYAHLAGPGRKSTFIQAVRARMAREVIRIVGQTLRDEVSKL